jgi:hypothetical protein
MKKLGAGAMARRLAFWQKSDSIGFNKGFASALQDPVRKLL